jgi:hypothetical protein
MLVLGRYIEVGSHASSRLGVCASTNGREQLQLFMLLSMETGALRR